MRRFTVLYILLLAAWSPRATASAQDARQRQAAAEAYDRGTAAYLEGSYTEAAQWFETANRMAPAAPALMQAIRAHEHADNHTRAATLAVELQSTYATEPQATEYAKNVLASTAPKLLLIQVTCDEDCKLDVDGKLQEYLAFFDTPGKMHTLTATFETGSKTTKVQGEAGQTREVKFEAPPPPPTPAIDFASGATQSKDGGTAGRPLPPLVTWIGIGVTGAVLAATIVSAVDMYNGVPKYEDLADRSVNCSPVSTASCMSLAKQSKDELDKGQSRELRTNILIGATAFAAVSTGVIALFLTDWSTRDAATHDTETLGLRVEPRPGGLSTTLEGRF
jgi:phosphotransferase system HPr-like phosphotransfer protein